MKYPVLIILLFLPAVQAHCIESRDTHFFFGSLPGHVKLNDDPTRDHWQQPDNVIDRLLIRKGDRIADIGAGTGYFTLRLARRAGAHGTVFAVDVEQRMLDLIESRAANDGIGTIRTILATPDDPLLPRASIDLVFICNTYFNFPDKVRYLSSLKQGLNSKGRVAIIEHRRDSTHDKPPLHKRTPREQVLSDFKKAGYMLEAEYDFLPYQYFLIFRVMPDIRE